MSIIDDYSRFLFAFPCADLTFATVIMCLTQIFCMIKMSGFITRNMVNKEESVGFNRNEFSVLAQMSLEAGHIEPEEAIILKNLLLLQKIKIKDAMTPRTVVFCDSQDLRVEEFFHKHKKVRFTRIPVYDKKPDEIVGFVIRADLLLAQARGNKDVRLSNYIRDMPTLLDDMTLSHAMKEMLLGKTHIALIVNEYGTVRGILTLEDILETLIGYEILDEGDKYIDMQKQLVTKVTRKSVPYKPKEFQA